MKYKNASIKKYLDDLAARTPTPGGGSAAALSGALGCALLSMAANFTVGKEKYRQDEGEIKKILAKTENLRKRFLGLVDLDAVAYLAYANAASPGAKNKAKKESQKVVKDIAKLSYAAIKLCAPLAEKGNVYLINDVLAGAELLQAAFNSALINLKG